MTLAYTSCSLDSSDVVPKECIKDRITSPFLVAASEAHRILKEDSNAIFIYVTKPEKFELAHIPNSLSIWRPDFRSNDGTYNYGGMRCSKSEMEGLLSRLGVTDQSSLYLYDNKGSVDALRFAWVLEYYGYDRYKVINGGLKRWQLDGYEIAKGKKREVKPSRFFLQTETRTDMVAHKEDVLTAIEDEGTLIVDTREVYEHLGQPYKLKESLVPFKKGAFSAGCIPTSIHFNWSILSDLANDHRIKCKKDLMFDLSSAGIHPEKNIIVYCQSGSRSSHTAFVLKHILGYPNVRNYDGSWIEWSYVKKIDNSLPIVQHWKGETK